MHRQTDCLDTLIPTPDRRLTPESAHQWDRVIVLANRAPVRHEHSGDGVITIRRSASGVTTALEPIVDACQGTWIAHANGDADMAAAQQGNGLAVTLPDQRYRLRYVRLSDEQYEGYYYGFANQGLWPLSHAVPVKPVFRPDDYAMYRKANRQFSSAVVEEAAGGSALVLVQDYHFALAPRILRRRLTRGSTIVSFWHIPWPDPRGFSTCPWAAHLLDGLLASDILGFQTQGDRDNFLDAASTMLDADVLCSNDVVIYRDHPTCVRVYPVGVEWNNPIVRATPSVESCRAEIIQTHQLPADVRLGVGIDRLDYTKGINEKFLAIERLLARHPEIRERFTFIQVAEPSRERLPEYRATRAQIEETARRINTRFRIRDHQPIRLLDTHHEPADVYRLYRAADFCHVGSLDDGMNLVAKEFVCARNDERGVLVLSQHAGAARQLRAAVLIDPYAIDAAAEALASALAMPASEQEHRMQLLRANVASFDAHWWGGQLLDSARRVKGLGNECDHAEHTRPAVTDDNWQAAS
ncbi:MAG TPA: trehalose-6-phosphate synthase [Vicinamibacterales bacterium]|nr:trehalose-6-phosphate synthase [Vicinamibacterales bacterium]